MVRYAACSKMLTTLRLCAFLSACYYLSLGLLGLLDPGALASDAPYPTFLEQLPATIGFLLFGGCTLSTAAFPLRAAQVRHAIIPVIVLTPLLVELYYGGLGVDLLFSVFWWIFAIPAVAIIVRTHAA